MELANSDCRQPQNDQWIQHLAIIDVEDKVLIYLLKDLEWTTVVTL